MNETKTIFIYAESVEQAKEYIKTHIKVITDEHQLCGYTEEEAVIVALPQKDVIKEAKERGIKIIEA